MIDFFKNNYEWIFSGIGVVVLTWLFPILIKRNSKKKKNTDIEVSIENGDDNKVKIVNKQKTTINHIYSGTSISESDNSDLKYAIPLGIETLEKKDIPVNVIHINAAEAFLEIQDCPPFQQENLIKSYLGNLVIWDVSYESISSTDGDIITIMSKYKGLYPWVYFVADLNEYPFFKVAKRKELFQITGTISNVVNGGFTLNVLKITAPNNKF